MLIKLNDATSSIWTFKYSVPKEVVLGFFNKYSSTIIECINSTHDRRICWWSLDSLLIFHDHIKLNARQLSTTFGTSARSGNSLTLAASGICPCFEPSNSIYCVVPVNAISRLKRVQNRTAKVVFKILSIVFKCLHDMAPECLSNLVQVK